MDEMAAKVFGVSSFTAVGHLLHINLKDHLLVHKHQIGVALLKNNPRAVAVVNKVNSIDNTYRNFEIEVIAKREDCEKSDEELMIVEVKENKCRFRMDFSRVYWNSRLGTEHERIINKLNKFTDIVFDLFAGVGPFAVPAAKAKCKTYANDLNPDSVKWLDINMKANKVERDMFEVYNMDAKEFITTTMKERLLEEYKRYEDEELATKPVIHFIMNLPALAPTFLPNFVGLFKNELNCKLKVNSKELIEVFNEQSLEHIVHCYCFLKGAFDDPKGEVKNMVEEQLGRELNDTQLIEIFRVRNVAPYKEMYRVDLRLDASILFDLKGIMKSKNRLSTNGVSKKVTIQAPNGKRPHEDSADSSSEENDSKKAKLSEYCTII